MLQSHIANPLVIIDEIDKIPDVVMTGKGTTRPGAFEVLKSMIEPTTSQAWTRPYYRVPFNLSAVNWVMTTNSTALLPASFRDRCKVIELKRSTNDQLLAVAQQRILAGFPDHLRGPAEQLVEGALRQREWSYQSTSRGNSGGFWTGCWRSISGRCLSKVVWHPFTETDACFCGLSDVLNSGM